MRKSPSFVTSAELTIWRVGGQLALAAALALPASAAVRFVYSPLDFRLVSSSSANRYAPEAMPGGLALFDYDGDGDLDIFFTNGADLPSRRKTRPEHSNRLLRNDGAASFRDVTQEAGLAGSGYDFGAAAADYDNDGDTDLFVAGLHHNALYRNDGGRFTDVTMSSGFAPPDADQAPLWAIAGAWFDYDNDGLLDLFIVNYLRWEPGLDPLCGEGEQRDYCHPRFYEGTPNQLFRNLGEGAFADVSQAAGIGKHVGKGMGAAVADFDRDGRLDVFVTNDKEPNFLFRNQAGKSFAEVGFESTVALPEHGDDVSGMGLDARDLTGDGLPDIVYAALPEETFPLFVNTAEGYFEDATSRSGLAALTKKMAGYSAVIADFDNDGHKDLFFSCGDVLAGALDRTRKVDQTNALFRNLGGGRFEAPPSGAGFAGGPARRHRGAGAADLNGDGRLDLVVTAIDAEAELWLNTSEPALHWVAFQLEGTSSNRDGIGAEIHIESGGERQVNLMTSSVGYASSSVGPVQFGLGSAARVEKVEIHWPSGQVQRLDDLEADRVIKVREPR